MAEEVKTEASVNQEPQKTRRVFVRTAAQVAMTVPAVTILLGAEAKPASAQILYQSGDGIPVANEGLIDDGRFDHDLAPPP